MTTLDQTVLVPDDVVFRELQGEAVGPFTSAIVAYRA
jgi:hypothetical protein